METNTLPKMNMDRGETGCCPKFDAGPWDEKEFVFKDKLFVKTKTLNFLHIPLNMGSVMTKTFKKIQKAQAETDGYLILSHDPSPWKGEHYFAVSKEVPNAELTHLSGTYVTKVYEGPYKDAGKWCKNFQNYISQKGVTAKKTYFFYTTCPKCLKHYGKNYVKR